MRLHPGLKLLELVVLNFNIIQVSKYMDCDWNFANDLSIIFMKNKKNTDSVIYNKLTRHM